MGVLDFVRGYQPKPSVQHPDLMTPTLIQTPLVRYFGVFCIASTLLSGCASYNSLKTANTDNLTASASNRTKVSTYDRVRWGEVISSTGYCDVVLHPEEADVVIDLTLRSKDSGDPYLVGVISGFTLMLVPTWWSNNASLTATVTTKPIQGIT